MHFTSSRRKPMRRFFCGCGRGRRRRLSGGLNGAAQTQPCSKIVQKSGTARRIAGLFIVFHYIIVQKSGCARYLPDFMSNNDTYVTPAENTATNKAIAVSGTAFWPENSRKYGIQYGCCRISCRIHRAIPHSYATRRQKHNLTATATFLNPHLL